MCTQLRLHASTVHDLLCLQVYASFLPLSWPRVHCTYTVYHDLFVYALQVKVRWYCMRVLLYLILLLHTCHGVHFNNTFICVNHSLNISTVHILEM